jgi:hypothetical protein
MRATQDSMIAALEGIDADLVALAEKVRQFTEAHVDVARRVYQRGGQTGAQALDAISIGRFHGDLVRRMHAVGLGEVLATRIGPTPAAAQDWLVRWREEIRRLVT